MNIIPGYAGEQTSVDGKDKQFELLTVCNGVSLIESSATQSFALPQICLRFNQWPTSCVAVLPKLKGASALPSLPKYLCEITTPSVFEGMPGNWAKPNKFEFWPPNSSVHIFKYESLFQIVFGFKLLLILV